MKANQLVAMLILALSSLPSWATQPADSEIIQRFELMKPDKCMKPRGKEHKDKLLNPQYLSADRYYLDLDGDGICEIINIMIGRLTPLPNDNRLMNFSEIHQYKKGRWVYAYGSGEDFSPFDYVPKYQLRDKTTGRIYYLFDFEFNSGTGLWIHAHGTKYFDRWPTQKERLKDGGTGERPYGIKDCVYISSSLSDRTEYDRESSKKYRDFTCDGFALGQVIKALLEQKGNAQPASNKQANP